MATKVRGVKFGRFTKHLCDEEKIVKFVRSCVSGCYKEAVIKFNEDGNAECSYQPTRDQIEQLMADL